MASVSQSDGSLDFLLCMFINPHRSKEGVQTTEIELATKILDSEGLFSVIASLERWTGVSPIVAERIQNTLSHEMCHLASWIIDGDPKEGHGKIWKAW